MSDPFSDPIPPAPAKPTVIPPTLTGPVPIEPAVQPGEPARRSVEELQLFADTDELVDDRFCKADKMAIFAMRQVRPK